MKIKLLCAFTFLISTLASGQGKFTCTLSTDSLDAGQYARLTYQIENLEGDLELPKFDGVKVVGGPSVSTQMSIVNGKKSSRKKYEYILYFEDAGEYYMGSAAIVSSKSTIETGPVRIVVNNASGPEGKAQINQSRPWSKTIEVDENGEQSSTETTPSKPKRVLRKI